MTWFVVAYALIAYYHFHQMLRCLEKYDTIDTAILNSIVVLTVGPLLFVPVWLYGSLDRLVERIVCDDGR